MLTSSIERRPEVTSSNPAVTRRVVVFPQPLGPSRVKNSPSVISRSIESTAVSSPKRFVTDSRTTQLRPFPFARATSALLHDGRLRKFGRRGGHERKNCDESSQGAKA